LDIRRRSLIYLNTLNQGFWRLDLAQRIGLAVQMTELTPNCPTERGAKAFSPMMN
jgi:hypothetical protein